MYFDPVRNQWKFSPEGGTLSRLLGHKLERKGPTGNYAVFDLSSFIFGWFGGFKDELAPALDRTVIWLNRAIESDEKFRPAQDYHRRNLYKTRAIVRWMLNSDTCIEDWHQANIFDGKDWNFKDPPQMDFGVQLRFEDRLAFLFQAGEYDECMDLYSRMRSNRPIQFGAAADLEDYVCIACAAHKGKHTSSTVSQLGEQLLLKYLESNWLIQGQATTAAMWLKIVLWDPHIRAGRAPSLTPLETILKAYEYMPHVETPEFVLRQSHNR